MKKLSPLEKMGLVAAVVVACTYFYMKKVYEPQEKILKTTVAELNKIVGEINNLKTVPPVSGVKSQLKKHKSELKELEYKLNSTMVRTGSEWEVSHFLSVIIDMMERRGLTVRNITPKKDEGSGGAAATPSETPPVGTDPGKAPAKPDELFVWHPYDVELSGGYYGFVGLLIDLRKKPDAVKIEKIEITQKEGASLSIKMNLKI